MEAAGSSEMLRTFFQTTRSHVAGDGKLPEGYNSELILSRNKPYCIWQHILVIFADTSFLCNFPDKDAVIDTVMFLFDPSAII
jgi:hypothetical protein